ncbi:hypothetical protein BSKO_07411 [Bryopsis sp. KO-2023]|nr:hypothetical protein BSKO_07411 [Bryopsis sp. KO-2023]
MRLEKCWFCSSTCYPGKGITFVRNDATIFRFCRSKCHNSFKNKRNPRRRWWTKTCRKLRGKELAEDTTFEMERKRNRPEKYNRVLMQKTVKAMKRVTDIRSRRQDAFFEARMKEAKKTNRTKLRQEIEKDIRLVKAPESLLKENLEKEEMLRVEAEPVEMEED